MSNSSETGTAALVMTAAVSSRHLELELEVQEGECVAVLGPNGAGKSTLLDVLAGILRPDSGRASLHGKVLYDRGSRRGWVPPHARGIALLAQDPLLFPHLSVLDNVAFGPRAGGRRVKQARGKAHEWLAAVGASELAERMPSQLSGGQAQRVAIARALAAEPRLLLLDEPMAALDVGTAPMLRRVLSRVLPGRTAIIVTHDLLDALLLASRVVVIDHGRIVESGLTSDVISHPRTPFTARIAGLNLVRGTATGPSHLRDAHGTEVEGTPSAGISKGESVIAVFGPTSVAVYTERHPGSPRNSFPVVITELEPRDSLVRVRGHGPSGASFVADVTLGAVSELGLYPGKEVLFSVKATAITLYPA